MFILIDTNDLANSRNKANGDREFGNMTAEVFVYTFRPIWVIFENKKISLEPLQNTPPPTLGGGGGRLPDLKIKKNGLQNDI